MAFDSDNLYGNGNPPGRATYRYDTLDALTTVDGAGYFNNTDDSINLAVGDVIEVVVWATAVYTGTISGIGKVIVNSVSSGSVDTTNDIYGATIIDSD